MNQTDRIFIVEDEEDIANLIKYNLEREGYQAECFKDAESFVQNLNRPFSLLLLDLMLPGMSGLEILKRVRAEKSRSNIPVIIITAKDTEVDKILGLELGADDYVTKPFSVRELVARVKAVLRRAAPTAETVNTRDDILSFKDLVLHLDSFKIMLGEERIESTKTEFLILKILLSNPGKVFTRDLLLEKLWGNEKIVVDRTIDVHIKRLRDKLRDYGKYLKTIRGVGYSFSED